MRRFWRLLIFVFAVYGPLAPTVILFLLVVPPLVFWSGWPGWIQAGVFATDVVTLLGVAIALGPGALEEFRAELDAEHRS
jgi:hypothetical protein